MGVVEWPVEARDADVHAAESNGRTALLATEANGHEEWAKWLTEKEGADKGMASGDAVVKHCASLVGEAAAGRGEMPECR